MPFPDIRSLLSQAAQQGGPPAHLTPQGPVDPQIAALLASQLAKSAPQPNAPIGMQVPPGTAPFPLSPAQVAQNRRYQSLTSPAPPANQ